MLANGSRKTPASDKQKRKKPVKGIRLPKFIKDIIERECALMVPPDGDVVIGAGNFIVIGEATQTLARGTQCKTTITYAGGVPTKMCKS